MNFTFKGTANPDDCPPIYFVGYREGWVIGYLDKRLCDGKYGSDWGSGGGVSGYYGNGFAEGNLSGKTCRILGGDKPKWIDEEMIKFFNL